MEKTQEFDDEIEIDLRELLAVLLSQWLLILVVTVLGGGIAFGISHYMIVPQYESTSQLYVLSKSTSITSLADIQTGTSLTNDYMVVVEGRPVLEQVNNPANSRILEITVRDENPAMAKKIADEIADVGSTFIAAKMVQDAPMIIQKGYADGEPVSPNIIKNTLIGAVLGAFLAMAIIVISYLFNDTIITAEDVEKKLGLNVLGTLPLEEAEDDGENCSGSKKGFSKARKKSKKRAGDKS